MKLAGALADSTASPDAVIGVPGWATLRLFRWDELALEMTTFGSFRAAQVALRARAPDPVATIVTSSPFWALEPAKAMPPSWQLAGAHAGIVLGRRPDRVSWIALAVGDRRGRLHRGYSSAASVRPSMGAAFQRRPLHRAAADWTVGREAHGRQRHLLEVRPGERRGADVLRLLGGGPPVG